MAKIKIPAAKIGELKHNERNPRKITDARLAMLEKSMEEFGDLGCIVFNTRLNHLTGGHQRGRVLPKDAQIVIEERFSEPTSAGTTAEGHVLFNGEKFKYREVDWDETKDKAANLAANKHGGDFDYSLLSEILLELDSANINMDLTGFNEEDLVKILAPLSKEGIGSTEIAEFEFSKQEHICPKCGFTFNDKK